MPLHTETPGFDDIVSARDRIRGLIRETPVVSSARLNEKLGCFVFLKCENLQETGAFKLRGASNAIARLREQGIDTDVATHSSGNHGAALARAATADGRKAFVVMPDDAVRPKVESVRAHGGEPVFCEPTQQAREAGLEKLVSKGLVPIPPYDHPDIIAGQGTASLEFLEQCADLDFLMTPVGGGGLISGAAIVARHLSPRTRVIGAEPLGAADTQASFRAGKRVAEWKPETIADGLRALVGKVTFPIILDLVHDVLTVSEEGIRKAVSVVFACTDMIIEPSSATVIAAVMEHPERFRGKRVGMILSGGNIDMTLFPELESARG